MICSSSEPRKLELDKIEKAELRLLILHVLKGTHERMP